ncbi:MAG: diguanylate cyclase [Bacillota bacterium]
MIRFLRDLAADPAEEDPLEAYRDRAMYMMSTVGVLMLAPLVANNIYKRRYELAISIVVVLLFLAIDAYAIYRKRKPPIPYGVVVIPTALAIGIALKTLGAIGAYWCYPTILFFYFVLRRRAATLCGLSMLTAATWVVYWYIGFDVATRFFLSLALMIVIVNIILNIVGDLHRRLVDQAITDPLTGAFNRRHMQTRLEESVERGRRSGSAASLLLIDIDHFKRINDRFGHEAGDNVLKGLVIIIRERMRKSDLLFRIGGEEFLLLLPDTPQEAALGVAEELRETVASAPVHPAVPATISIGVSALDARDTKAEDWVKRADDAMYEAKRAGRNRVIAAPMAASTPVMEVSQ